MINKIYEKDGMWHFDEYFNFMEENKMRIPENIRHEILNSNRYLFNTHETLHDSWVLKMNYQINIEENKSEFTVLFLGPFHNKLYKFHFFDVVKLDIPKKTLIKKDLIVHQFGFDKKEYYTYEFIFSNGKKIGIIFKELEFSIENIN